MAKRYVFCLSLTALLLAGCGSDSSNSDDNNNDGKCPETCVRCENGTCLDNNDDKKCDPGCIRCENGTCLDNNDDKKCDPGCVRCENGTCLDVVPKVCTPECGFNQICDDGTCVSDLQNHSCSKCTAGQTCVNAECVNTADACERCGAATVCVGGICYDEDTMIQRGCLSCTKDQVCRNNRCYNATDFCATCAPDEQCKNNRCVPADNPCIACSAEESCVEGECVACENPVCSGVCCFEGEGCDLYTGRCAPLEESTGKAPCNARYCYDDSVCSESGICERQCDDGRDACSYSQICCKEGYACHNNAYCRIVCDETHVMCGKEKQEVCCDEGEVCFENECHIACDESTGTRCGANYEFCCDNATEVCVYGKCLVPTSDDECETERDCDVWSSCDAASKRCVSALEIEAPCTYTPPIGEFKPVKKWHYPDNVVATPIVINLTDDNGDERVDEKDIPEIVFVNTGKYLKAVDGKTGQLTAASSNKIYNQHNDIAAADIDNDGEIEVVVPSSQQKSGDNYVNYLYAMVLRKKSSGTGYEWVQKYRSPSIPNLKDGWADIHPTIADVNADGTPDIVTTRGVLKGNAWSSFQCKLNLSRWSTWYHNFYAVADLDQDGKMEIIDTDIYDATTTGGGDCAVLMNHSNAAQSMKMDGSAANFESLYTAVADLIEDENDPAHPGELKPEIVRVRSGRVSVWKVYKNGNQWIQRLVWDKPQTSSSGGGNPVIADFDGDGQRDIGVAGRTHYSVFNGQTGNIVWAGKTIDASSERTGSSVFDFEGDGIAEVVYRDETRIRIYSGKGAGYNPDGTVIDKDNDGYMDDKVLWWFPNTSGTVIEYPLIVDVDNDGRTEIVMVSEKVGYNSDGNVANEKYGSPKFNNGNKNPYFLGSEWTNLPTGIDVYRDTSDNWVRTRRIWNQHAYHVTNINEDGTVPVHEEPNWLNPHLNNYRMNVQPLVNFAPNFVPGELTYTTDHCEDKTKNVELTLTLSNIGALGVSDNVGISIYADNYTYNGAPRRIFLGTAYTNQSISAGATVTVNFSWDKTGTVIIDKVEHKLTDMTPDGLQISYYVDKAEDNPDYVAFNECIENDNETSASTKLVECETIIY